ncbi:MAG: glycosyltransferase [Actinomycetota bacterium]|nr:glycosyltransferase [Actinomycetota bacterium]
MQRVAVVHAVMRSGGATTRMEWWKDVLALSGIEVVAVPLVPDGPRPLPRGLGRAGAALTGAVSLESLAWSGPALRRRLDVIAPDGVVVISLRAFDPTALPGGLPVVLDYVDRLSESYGQRALIERRRLYRAGWHVLARTMARAESAARVVAAPTVAAGYRDAAALGAAWFPITLPADQVGEEPPQPAEGDSPVDVLFTGTLDYGPNVAAIRELASSIWPEVVRLRPGSSLCVAGRRPTREVRDLVRAMGAELVPDFAGFGRLVARATLSIAPLPFATGMQIKVLEAAAAGRPQVISPAAAAGFAPGLPVRIAEVGRPFAHQIVALLDDPAGARDLGCQAQEEVRLRYTHERVAARVRALFDPPELGARSPGPPDVGTRSPGPPDLAGGRP